MAKGDWLRAEDSWRYRDRGSARCLSPFAPLQRLADAYRVASQTHFAHRRLAAQLDDLKKKELAQENDQLLAVANQYIKARTNDLHAQAIAACPSPHAAPDGPNPPS